jgi:hypothetical protein
MKFEMMFNENKPFNNCTKVGAPETVHVSETVISTPIAHLGNVGSNVGSPYMAYLFSTLELSYVLPAYITALKSATRVDMTLLVHGRFRVLEL